MGYSFNGKDGNDLKDKVYFITDYKAIKIGYTSKPIKQRLLELSTGNPNKLYLVGFIYGNEEVESQLHSQFDKYRIRRNGEWFYFNENLINYINENNIQENTWIEYDKKLNEIQICMAI